MTDWTCDLEFQPWSVPPSYPVKQTTNRWWVSAGSMATKSHHIPLDLQDIFSTACFMSECFMIFKQFFFLPEWRGRHDSPAVWQLYQIPSGLFCWWGFRGWISMTMGRKMKAGSISSEAFISNGTVTKKENQINCTPTYKGIMTPNLPVNSFSDIYDAIHDQASHFGTILRKKILWNGIVIVLQ